MISLQYLPCRKTLTQIRLFFFNVCYQHDPQICLSMMSVKIFSIPSVHVRSMHCPGLSITSRISSHITACSMLFALFVYSSSLAYVAAMTLWITFCSLIFPEVTEVNIPECKVSCISPSTTIPSIQKPLIPQFADARSATASSRSRERALHRLSLSPTYRSS